jgi:trehalose 6-phosphate phosphatase
MTEKEAKTPGNDARSPEDWAPVIDRLAVVPRLLVALDFDGTLAPEVDDPEQARALPAASAAILALHALPNTIVALVSGRALASLALVSEAPDDLPLVGSHGLELRFGVGDAPPAIDATDAARLNALRSLLEPLVDAAPGAWLEEKPAGIVVHYRLVTDAKTAALLAETVRTEAAALDSALTVRAGKNVVEFAVRDATKGDGLRALRERFAPDAVFFAGDDVTDEDAIAALEPHDVGVKVGVGETGASMRLASPDELTSVLERLLDARRALSANTR